MKPIKATLRLQAVIQHAASTPELGKGVAIVPASAEVVLSGDGAAMRLTFDALPEAFAGTAEEREATRFEVVLRRLKQQQRKR